MFRAVVLGVLLVLVCGCGPESQTYGAWRFDGAVKRQGVAGVTMVPYTFDFTLGPGVTTAGVLIKHGSCIFTARRDVADAVTLDAVQPCDLPSDGTFPVLEVIGISLAGQRVILNTGTFQVNALGELVAELTGNYGPKEEPTNSFTVDLKGKRK